MIVFTKTQFVFALFCIPVIYHFEVQAMEGKVQFENIFPDHSSLTSNHSSSKFNKFQIQFGDYFLKKSKLYRYPMILTDNSRAQLFDSVDAIYNNFNIQLLDQPYLYKIEKNNLFLSSKLPIVFHSKEHGDIPLIHLWALTAVTFEVAQLVGLDEESKWELSHRLHRLILKSLKIKWNDYAFFLKTHVGFQSLLLAQLKNKSLISNKRLIGISQYLMDNIELDATFDIPYLAGYSIYGPQKIYFDRGLTLKVITKNGYDFDITPYLLMHEFFEKGYMDILRLKNNNYLRTHQLAQRLEQELIKTSSTTWSEYQNEIMKEEIRKAGNRIERVPSDLDLTPYIDYKDSEVIKKMIDAMMRSL